MSKLNFLSIDDLDELAIWTFNELLQSAAATVGLTRGYSVELRSGPVELRRNGPVELASVEI